MFSAHSPSRSLRSVLRLGALLALVWVPCPALAATVSILEAVNPIYPPALKASGVQGEAKVRVQVGADGRVLEVELLSATEEAFGVSAVEAVKRWSFRPATKEGQAVASTVAIPVRFELSAEEQFNAAIGREVFVDRSTITEPIHDWKSLQGKFDAEGNPIKPWRAPRKLLRPKFPDALKGSGVTEEVRVEFIITPDGFPLNPSVKAPKHPEFALPALVALVNMRFQPLRVDGQLVYSKQVFKFTFAEE